MSGSEGGLEKPTHRKMDTALQPDPYEGSTRRWEADPEEMRRALAAHDEVLRSAIEMRGGWLFKHTGDGVCAAFSVAEDAVATAVDAQGRLGLPVRMGIATGGAELRGDDYFGPALNRAARVVAAGHGGQILVAAATAALVSAQGLVDLGERRLRDLSGAEHLFQVRAEGLRVEFPPLRTLDATPGNLPVQSTSFVGRHVEVKELCELIRAHRMVTLTGVGGVGKTRLAVQVAAESTGEFPDGVWLVELAPVGDPAAVPDVVATTLGVTAQAGESVTAAVTQALSGRRLLLVLDNCEHVLNAAADLVEAILARASMVAVVATSREGLGVAAERLSIWPRRPVYTMRWTSTPFWTCWILWCVSRWSPRSGSAATPVTACWKPSASSRKTNSRLPPTVMWCGMFMPGTSPKRRSPTGTFGTAPANASRWHGSASSSRIYALRSVGRATRAISPPRRRSPRTLRWSASACNVLRRSDGPRRYWPRPPPPMCANYPVSTPQPLFACTPGISKLPPAMPKSPWGWRPMVAMTLSQSAGAACGKPERISTPVGSSATWRSAPA